MPRPPLPPVPPLVKWATSLGASALFLVATAVPEKISRPAVGPDNLVWADVTYVPVGALTSDQDITPNAEQKKPPCRSDFEVEYRGYCWLPHASKPPCKKGSVEGGGQCLLPVPKPRRPNTSLDH